MLTDWLWAFVIALAPWIEAAAIARWSRRWINEPVSFRLTLGFAILSLLFFSLSLIGAPGHAWHAILPLVAFVALLIPQTAQRRAKGPRFETARFFSPMSWARAWPWLLLPAIWGLLRPVDALAPHPHAEALSVHLAAAKNWFETGRQILSPLQPELGLASLWDGLYFHSQGLAHAIGGTHRHVLVRAQVASQLLHFTAGQLLSIALLSSLLHPMLMGATSSPRIRHHAGAAALFLAWLACAQPPLSSEATVATQTWGATLFVLGALSFFLRGHWIASGLLWGAATATLTANVWAGLGLLATGFLLHPLSLLPKIILRIGIGALIGIIPWSIRNWTQSGGLTYPNAQSGWLSEHAWSTLLQRTALIPDAMLFPVLVAGGLTILFVSLWHLRASERKPAVAAPATLTQIGALFVFGLSGLFAGWTAPYLTVLVLLASVFTLHLFAQRLHSRFLPYGWFAVGLLTVSLHVHVLWQHLGLAFVPPETYLRTYHHNYPIKHWASLHLPRDRQIAWLYDNQTYYVNQRSSTISTTNMLIAPIERATNPRQRVHVLCSLGFDTLAWEEQRQNELLTGVLSWLKVTSAPVLHSTETVTLFDLRPVCPLLEN